MDMKEKLVEILRKPIFPHELVDPIEAVADYLLDSGVTVQEWISVKDRLPTAEDALLGSSVYAYTKAKKVLVLHYQYVCRRSDYIFCWMPIAMPQPPNEGEQ